MLERTSACLDTGVRLSLRPQRLFPKSRRLLHSAFWTPQAPHVDVAITIPSASASIISPSASYPPSPDPQDAAPFLDFLYPAPTQAFMTRLSQWERWSRRNTRLPVLRGYSSLTTPKDSSPRPPIQELRDLLADHNPSPLQAERAWSLASHVDFSDPHLLLQLILWFAAVKTKSAATHLVDLFDRLSDEHKSASAYRAAIAANLFLDRDSDAIRLHDQASKMPPDGSIGSELLMSKAVNDENWPLALSIMQSFELYSSSAPPSHASVLWTTVKRHKELEKKLYSLQHYCEHQNTASSDPASRRLFGTMLNQFIHRQSRNPLFVSTGLAADNLRGSVRKLIYSMYRYDLASTEAFEAILETLLRIPGAAIKNELTALITFTYLLYRRSRHFNPSEAVLLRMLKHWRSHKLAFAGSGPTRSFISKGRIVSDWQRFYQKPSDEACVVIMDTFARLGDVAAVEKEAAFYVSLHPEGIDNSKFLWPVVYVHATLANPTRAAEQLRRIKEDYRVSPNLRCWNVVLHAFEEADDLTGAAKVFAEMTDTGIKPDVYSYGSLLNLYAKRGDVDGVIDLLNLAKSNGVTRPTVHMLNSMIVALVNSEDIEGAEQALDRCIQAVRTNEAEGSLTMCFNTLLVAYALRRDLQATMGIYRRMRDNKVPLDDQSYGALMQVLCVFRQSPSAHKILKSVMPGENIRPKAFHYSILMAGYMNQDMYSEALRLEWVMQKEKVRMTAGCRAIALKAKALHEHHSETADEGETGTAESAIEDFKQLLDDPQVFPRGNQPSPGFRHESSGSLAMDVGHLIYIHGKQHSFEAVSELLRLYQDKLSQTDGDVSTVPTMRLLTALMSVHCQAREFAEVDRYWELIRSRADEIRLAHIPATELNPKHDIATRHSPATTQILPALRFMLSRPLDYYIVSQFSQSSPGKIVSIVTELLSLGFAFDNKTWNKYIVQLCQTSPPRALLAYTLVERFMMQDWPGWISARRGLITNKDIFPRKSARAQGLTYIKARYLAPGQLMPQYETMVHLAHALLEVRGFETSGMAAKEQGRDLRELKRQVGTIREIRERAPKALHAVKSMPRVNDQLQMQLLGGIR